MENQKQEMIFVEGLTFKPRAENAPETVRGGMYFKYPEFARFMEKHKNEKGWVNVKMMKSKEKGTIYFILDTWKPTKTAEQEQQSKDYENRYRTTSSSTDYPDGINVSSHPLVTEQELNDIPF